MKRRQLFMSLLSVMLAAAPAYALEKYTLDPHHSAVNWQISHFGFSNPSGKWYANGMLELDEKKPQDSKVKVTINVADIITGIPKLDEHLRSEEFFDTAKHPTATFVSDKVTMTAKDSANVEGKLTLHGVTQPVTLHVKLNKHAVSMLNNKMTAGFTATAEIKRSEFGIKTYLPGLGDDVKLNIEVEANKAG